MFKPYFRPGAGSIIYNDAGEILIFERADQPGTWQLQQGGMDLNEEPVFTLWREVHEETGLEASDLTLTHEYPEWTLYAYPKEIRARFSDHCLGQVHRWFFLKLNPYTTVDLSKAPDQEFTDWRWTSFPQLIAETGEMKREVYIKLSRYFAENIKPE